MFSFIPRKQPSTDLITSKLYNDQTFYPELMKDLSKCFSELLIESPFITSKRLAQLKPVLQKLKSRKVRVVINTRDPNEQDNEYLRSEAYRSMAILQGMGVNILYTGGHHRKLAIIDRHILYEGSLNILSQNDSCEVMRRIESTTLAWQMARFIGIDKFL